MSRPWSSLPIVDCGEPLQALPRELRRLEPHPYVGLGAPYGCGGGPFRLRAAVVERLLMAQERLRQDHPTWRLAIFDGWRPLAVQRFMVAHSITAECHRRQLDPQALSATPEGRLALAEVEQLVARFWAPPSEDPATPPPHSTGAAVDLTLAQERPGGDCEPLPMGGEIDALGPVSEPDHHAAAAAADPGSAPALWHRHRSILKAVMERSGFVQHPNEWWHFSHGDQLWAWALRQPAARYGRLES